MPDGEAVPRGVPLRREMMQCWVLRDKCVTCMPLALFHDFDDGMGPVAVVPELGRGDVVIWRTGHVLHGALTALARGDLLEVEVGLGEALGARMGAGAMLVAVDAGGRAAAAGLEAGDVLVAVEGEALTGNCAATALATARQKARAAGQKSLRMTFLLSRFNGRRSVEFRFFVYWPA